MTCIEFTIQLSQRIKVEVPQSLLTHMSLGDYRKKNPILIYVAWHQILCPDAANFWPIFLLYRKRLRGRCGSKMLAAAASTLFCLCDEHTGT